MSIGFFTDDIAFTMAHKGVTREWLKKVATLHGKTIGELAYIFVSSERILELNRKFLNHNHFTDIITFDDSEGTRLNGEMYVCIGVVERNAERFNTTFSNELNRVIVHGLLHLCGFDDKTSEDECRMRQLEDEALAMLPADE